VIDQKKGFEALGMLIKSGVVSASDADKYRRSVDEKFSYAQAVVIELGAEVSMRYLREEFVEHLHFTGKKLPFDTLSVPEVLLIENSEVEPWHKGRFSALSTPKKFQQEAAEPWHASLRSMFTTDPDVALWFNNHPKYINEAVKILATVDGKKPPREEDIAKLARG
jgi:hypothetical protein